MYIINLKIKAIVLNVDGTTTERKVRLSNIDVHETISDNVNIIKDNKLFSLKLSL